MLIVVPTRGLSIPNVPDGPFWDPAADADFLATVKAEIRNDIPVLTYDRHVNDSQFGHEVGELFVDLMNQHTN